MDRRALYLLGLLLMLGRPIRAQSCDFKGYSTFRVSDFVQTPVVTKVAPQYPEEAKLLEQSGSLYIRVLVDEKGVVEKACVDPKLSSISEGTLVEAAQTAAKKWTFKPNFGFPRVPKKLKGRFLEDTLGFKYSPVRPDQPDRKGKKDPPNQN